MTPPPLPDPGPLVEIPAGSIDLRDEGSRRTWTVEVAAFRLASVPVTRALDRTPVTDVSWLDALGFCKPLPRAAGLEPCYEVGTDRDAQDVTRDPAADGYRLPTEAEWEHACRAGTAGD